MLMNDHGLSGEGIPPAGLIELENAIGILNRVVIVHCALVLDAEDPVQILATNPHKGTPFLRRRNREAIIELSYVAVSEKPIRLSYILNPTHPQFLRQPALPSAETPLR